MLRNGLRRSMLAGIAAAPQPTVCLLLTLLMRHRQSIAALLLIRVPLRWRPGEVTFLETFPPPYPGGEVQDIRTRILPSSSELAFEKGRIFCSRRISRTPSTAMFSAASTAGREISISGCRGEVATPRLTTPGRFNLHFAMRSE